MDILQIVLLAIVTFIFAIDQFSLSELLYRPIIACTIIGAILGDMTVGMAIGGTYELMMIGNMPVGGAQPPNAVLGGVVACIFAIKSGLSIEEALGAAVPFAVFGQYVVTTLFAAMATIMAKADKAAEHADPAGIAQVNYISMAILGSLFALFAVLAFVGGNAMGETLKNLSDSPSFSWIMGGLGAAGGMMRFVGFAILLKIMLAGDMWGIYFSGFAFALIIGNIPSIEGATLLLIAFIGLGIAMNDYFMNVKLKSAPQAGGGFSDGI